MRNSNSSFKISKKMRENLRGYLFIGPNLIGYVIFVLLPVLFSLYLTFTEWNLLSGLEGIRFIGLDNYIRMWCDEWFISSIINNVIFSLQIPVVMALSLLVAIALNKNVYGKSTLRTMFFMPFITNVVAVSAVWMAMLSKYGPINSLLNLLGFRDLPIWLMNPKFAMPAIMAMCIWAGIGYNMVIYLAALQGIPKELYEATDIDGANPWDKFIHVTLPMISPTTFFILITSIIWSFKVFGQINIMTHGGPGTSTSVIVFYIYKTAYQFYEMGYASAMSWILFVIIFIVTFIQWQGQKKWVNYM